MIEITPELAEICGIHAGDGYFRLRERNKGEVDISGHLEEKNYYDYHVIPLFNKIFNLNIKGREFSRGTYGFVTYSKNVRDIFVELGFPSGKKSLIIKVPKLILKSKNKLFYARFLRGLFDTDGNLYFRDRRTDKKYSDFKRTHNYYPIITFTTVSQQLGNQILLLLKEIGFQRVRLCSHQPKNQRDSKRYIIYMSGNELLLKFFKKIGSKNSVKLSRFKIWEKFGFCPPHTTLKQREDILNDKLDIYNKGLIV